MASELHINKHKCLSALPNQTVDGRNGGLDPQCPAFILFWRWH